MLELPLLSPRVNRLFLQGKLVLEANGCLSGDLTEIRFGASAVSRRGALLNVPASERRKVLEDFLITHLGSFELLRSDVENLGELEFPFLQRVFHCFSTNREEVSGE